MVHGHYTTILEEYQGYHCEKIEVFENEKRILKFKSTKKSFEVSCPKCHGSVIGHGISKVKLTDLPYMPGCQTIFEVHQHRYKCCHCGLTFTEDNPFRISDFHLTKRCAEWILQLLKFKIPTLTIAEIFGIHWNTVRKLEKLRIEYLLQKEDEERNKSSYRPLYLAVDEFAIRKGHRYATCVMDLSRGDILWVGKGRSIKDFEQFFHSFLNSDYLSKVKAVAMDMNAAYNTLVKKYMPNAAVVYDRYHLQSQFGRDVLGQVRLEAARRHKETAMQKNDKDEILQEKRIYSQIKKARWILLQNNAKLSESKKKNLTEILENHTELAVCYAMKEKMVHLFEITDESLAREQWAQWFDVAINSGIPPLVKFGKQKLKRLDGLIAHATFHVNTGKLEGFNNKIKVAKRNAYGFRNLEYFFSYIRFLSLDKLLLKHRKM